MRKGHRQHFQRLSTAQFLDDIHQAEQQQADQPEACDGLEDDGHIIRQLIISLQSLVLRSKQNLVRRHTSNGQATPAGKLVSCLKRVLQVTAAQRVQDRLQDLVLVWLRKSRPRRPASPRDVEALVNARQEFWNSYRANTIKWEKHSKSLPPPAKRGAAAAARQAAAQLPTAPSSTAPNKEGDADEEPGEGEGEEEAVAATLSSPVPSPALTRHNTGGTTPGAARSGKRTVQLADTRPRGGTAATAGTADAARKGQHRTLGQLGSSVGGELRPSTAVIARRRLSKQAEGTKQSGGQGDSTGGGRGPRSAGGVRCQLGRKAAAGRRQPLDGSEEARAGATSAPPRGWQRQNSTDSCDSGLFNCSVVGDGDDEEASGRPILPPSSSFTPDLVPRLVHLRELQPDDPTASTHSRSSPRGGALPELASSGGRGTEGGGGGGERAAGGAAPTSPGRPQTEHVFPDMYDCQDTAAVVQSDHWWYFHECQRLQMVPRMPRLLLTDDPLSPGGSGKAKYEVGRGGGGGRTAAEEAPFTLSWDAEVLRNLPTLTVSGQDMKDKDLEALSGPLHEKVLPTIGLDMSHNKFSDGALAKFLADFRGEDVRRLNLTSSGAAATTVGVVVRRLLSEWTKMSVLQLASLNLSEAAWESLTGALLHHDRLTELDLSETGLGRCSQRSACSVAKFVAGAPHLERLNLAGNFILLEGFQALAEAVRRTVSLHVLDVSHNAMTHAPRAAGHATLSQSASQGTLRRTLTGGSPSGRRASAEASNSDVAFNSIGLLCEAIAENESLRELRLASSSLDYSVDVVLLAAMHVNNSLRVLDLSGNPHGGEGVKVLLRIVMASNSRLVHCDFAGFRECSTGQGVVCINFGVPTNFYSLNLAHPQHRATTRWLLCLAAEASSSGSPAAAFSNVVWNGHKHTAEEASSSWYWLTHQGGWEVPRRGHLSFDFRLDLDLAGEEDAAGAVRKWLFARRIPVNLNRFVMLQSVFDGLQSLEHKAILIRAISETLILKTTHLNRLLRTCPGLSDLIGRSLYGALSDGEQLLLFDLMGKNKSNARSFRREARSLFFFSEMLTTGSYDLNLDRLMDRRVVERLQVVSAWEVEIIKRVQAPDTSQHGNFEGARNIFWEGAKQESLVLFPVSDHGTLRLDYASPPHFAAKRAERTVENSLIDDLVQALEHSQSCDEDKVLSLRTVAHHLVLSVEQVTTLCKVFSNPNMPPALNPTAALRGAAKLQSVSRQIGRSGKVAREARLGPEGTLRSAFGLKSENPRMDAFVCLFQRCNDQGMLVTEQCLCNHNIFTDLCVEEAQRRLGRLRTFNALYCDGNCDLVPVGEKSTARLIAQLHAAQAKQARMSVKAEPLTLGPRASLPPVEPANNLLNIGQRYSLHLALHEDRILAKLLLRLADKEPGLNIIKPSWSERKNITDQGYDFIIPPTWSESIPKVGVFEFIYIVEKPEFVRWKERRALAERYCGWEKVQAPAKKAK